MSIDRHCDNFDGSPDPEFPDIPGDAASYEPLADYPDITEQDPFLADDPAWDSPDESTTMVVPEEPDVDHPNAVEDTADVLPASQQMASQSPPALSQSWVPLAYRLADMPLTPAYIDAVARSQTSGQDANKIVNQPSPATDSDRTSVTEAPTAPRAAATQAGDVFEVPSPTAESPSQEQGETHITEAESSRPLVADNQESTETPTAILPGVKEFDRPGDDERDAPQAAIESEGERKDGSGQMAGTIEIDDMWGVPRRMAILRQAGELLEPGAEHNTYTADACGHVTQICEGLKRGIDAPGSTMNWHLAPLDIADHAARVGNEPLARFGFDHASEEDKWRIYAAGYSTAQLSHQLLAEWRLYLDRRFEQSAASNPSTQASRLLALMQIELYNYMAFSSEENSDLREQHRANALRLVDEFDATMSILAESDAARSPDEYEHMAILAFARAGVWEGIWGFSPAYYVQAVDPTSNRVGSELTAKAAAGQLTHVERQILRRSGDTGRLLRWIDACQKARDREPPSLPSTTIYLPSQIVLEKLVPELMRRSGIKPTSPLAGLEMVLASGDMKAARAQYASILRQGRDRDNLRAALMMSEHSLDVQSTVAGHEVFETAFLRELVIARRSLRSGALQGQEAIDALHSLHEQVLSLQDPVTSLPSRAHLLQLYLSLAPDSPEVTNLSTTIETQWTTLEQRAGGDQELVALGRALRAAGLRLIPQWKATSGGGYVGLLPLSPLVSARTPDWTHVSLELKDVFDPDGIPVRLVELANMVRTAGELNTLLGEQRYVIHHTEDRAQLRGINHTRLTNAGLSYSRSPITVDGTWRSLYPALDLYDYREFAAAAGYMRTGWRLHTAPDQTERLQRLVGWDTIS